MKIQELIDMRKKFAYPIKRMIKIYEETFQRAAPEDYGTIVEGMLVARYKPWESRMQMYKTALSKDRLYIVEQFLRLQMGRFNNSIFMEFGIYEGGVTRMMLDLNAYYGKDNLIIAVDSFKGVRGAVKADKHKNGDYACFDENAVRNYINGAKIVKGRIPFVLEDSIRNGNIVFAHVDLDVYGPTLATLEYVQWNSALHCHSIVIVDDYGLETCPGVKQAVDEFVYKYPDKWTLIYLPTGQALLMKIK